MEVPLEETAAAIRLARTRGAFIAHNAAPGGCVPPETLRQLDALVVNEHELQEVFEREYAESGMGVGALGKRTTPAEDDDDDAASTARVMATRLSQWTGAIVIVTLGAKGAVCCLAATEETRPALAHLPPFSMRVSAAALRGAGGRDGHHGRGRRVRGGVRGVGGARGVARGRAPRGVGVRRGDVRGVRGSERGAGGGGADAEGGGGEDLVSRRATGSRGRNWRRMRRTRSSRSRRGRIFSRRSRIQGSEGSARERRRGGELCGRGRDGRGGGGDGRRRVEFASLRVLSSKKRSCTAAESIVRVTTFPPTTRATGERTNPGSTVFDFLTLTF
jgi:hypothetical protein